MDPLIDLPIADSVVYEKERAFQIASQVEDGAFAFAVMKAREETSSYDMAKVTAQLDENYQEAKAERLLAEAEYKRVNNKQINLRKYAELTKNV